MARHANGHRRLEDFDGDEKEELAAELRRTSCILLPTDELKVRWDFCMMALIVYSAISVPVRLAFSLEAEGTAWMWEVAVSLAFMADLAINFNVAYQAVGSDEWVVSRRAIAPP